ncbi:hypothetical protein [Deinococcus sp.]|uniref:hypothetical protein n=1 Tax=Deinococcus sp. TaxID=47478 RepID=UPI0025C2F87D|nr:hypothetical protein [Deinococcus sp.]
MATQTVKKKVVKVAPPPRAAAPLPEGLAAVRAALGALGFAVQSDAESGLSFMFEGGQYYIPAQGDDTAFYHLLFPNFWELESDEEYGRALLACDAVNRESKLVKLHTVEGDVWAGVEALHGNPEAFMAFLPRYLGLVQDSVRAFRDVMLAPLDSEEVPQDDTAG